MNVNSIIIPDGMGPDAKFPINIQLVKPTKEDGSTWDQTQDAANHMRYAHSLNLPELEQKILPRRGSAIIVGGAPSVKNHLEELKTLSKDPSNYIFAINWTHTWLINNGIVPHGLVCFEIDVEPGTVLKTAHPDVTYYICSHCDQKTFDQLQGFKRVLWHSVPNSEAESKVKEELFANSPTVGGGVVTFTRTLIIALFLGYRNFEVFGCDSSYPEDENTHVDGYETLMNDEKDGFYVYARNNTTNDVQRFRTIGQLTLQHEEFKEFCRVNHGFFTMRVHGDGLLSWSHRQMYPSMYSE